MTTINGTPSSKTMLNRLTPDQVALELKHPVDPKALEQAKAIFRELRGGDAVTTDAADTGGSQKVIGSHLIRVAQRLGDLPAPSSNDTNNDTPYIVSAAACRTAFDSLDDTQRTALVNIHTRVSAFAQLQRRSLTDATMPIPGGQAGHTVSPCTTAGCYAPGGRYPLPSSVVMTVATARAAGCPTVVLASPKPATITLAAAHVAGADLVLAVGGAQAVASMAYGVDDVVPPCSVICGPGNQWVTAAKSMVNGHCGIDMLAGPSEVLVICDETADAAVVAADLLAQAEHDVVARAILLTTAGPTLDAVEAEVAAQVQALPEPNQSTARQALAQSFAVVCDTMEECVAISDSIAPEHLEIQTKDSQAVADQCQHYGGLFIGSHAAEVLGDYGAGPNHTLPTGGTGRYTGGLSVFHFLRIRTWMRIDDAKASQPIVDDSIVLARLEGLEGHARAAEKRKF